MAVRVVLSVGLLAAAIWLAPQSLDFRQLAALGPGVIVACLLLSVLMIGLLAWRWQVITSGIVEGKVALPQMPTFIRLTWICLAVNQVVPSIVGGDAARVAQLTGEGVPAASAASSVVIDRFYGLIGLACLCLAGVPMLETWLLGPTLLATGALAAVIVLIVVALFIGGRRFDRAEQLWLLLRSGVSLKSAAVLIPAAVAVHVANVVVFLLIAHGLGAALPMLAAGAVMSAVLLISALPLSVAGWGVREFSMVAAFGASGVDHDKIVLASVAYGLFILVTQASGFLLFARRPRP
jgi:uncharacterized membrane protein YbhN (UPF0104 family)